MGKVILLALVLLGVILYQVAGPGAPGRSPRGTALAFARAAASPDCAERMRAEFPDVAGAVALCSPDLARALRTQAQVVVASDDGFSALVECFYGST